MLQPYLEHTIEVGIDDAVVDVYLALYVLLRLSGRI